MAIWKQDWWPPRSHPNNTPIVYMVWLNWDDDNDDGIIHTPWYSYVVLPQNDD